MATRREFLTTVGVGALSGITVLTARKTGPPPSLIDAYPAVDAALRGLADRHARSFTRGAELRLDATSGAFAASLGRPLVGGGERRQRISPDGLLTFAIDVDEPVYVSGEVQLSPDADLRPGLRASVLCDTTLVGAPMVTAPEWGIKEITDAAPPVSGQGPPSRIALAEWLLTKGRHHVTIAGPHARPAGQFGGLVLRATPREVREPVYTFAYISDTHVYGKRERLDWMNRKMGDVSGDQLRRTLDHLATESISFVLHGGDLTETAVRPEFDQVARIFAGQGLPVYACLGNHDVYLETSRADALELLGAHFPGGGLDYTFTKPPVRFVVMDVAIEKPELLGAKQEWLRQTLAADTRTPTIFAWHYAPYNRAGVSSCGFRVPDWSELGKRALLQTLQAAPNVFATLNGHDHWDEVNRLDGITHVQNAAFVEWPNTYRVVRVFPDRIEWEVRQVANRGYVRESIVPDKRVSWMIATRETDVTGDAPLQRPQ